MYNFDDICCLRHYEHRRDRLRDWETESNIHMPFRKSCENNHNDNT